MRENTSKLLKHALEVRLSAGWWHGQLMLTVFAIALLDDPKYVKALQRRAASNEILNTWSSLSSAEEGYSFCCRGSLNPNYTGRADYNTLLKLLPPGSETKDIQNKLQKLKPRLETAQKRETTEMLDKLKTLGNSILGKSNRSVSVALRLTTESGNFGLSTDNFKFEPNGQGGYSMNFSR